MKVKICIILMTAFAALLGTSAYFIYDYCYQANKQAEPYESLADVVEQSGNDEQSGLAGSISYEDEKTILPEYAELFAKNSDMVGWITVPDTKINYPVMQSKDEPDFYLKHGFDRAYSSYGCP